MTAPGIARARIFDLPYDYRVICSRISGWELWRTASRPEDWELLGGEYGGGRWLVLDVAGYVIVDSRPRALYGVV